MQRIKLAHHTGFCAGVRRAISIVEKTLSRHTSGVYSLGPVIHNQQVVSRLASSGLNVVSSIDAVPAGSILILPSHGSPKAIIAKAAKKKLKLVDVICPYVASVQATLKRMYKEGLAVVIVGDKDHPEIRALKDIAPDSVIISEPKDIAPGIFNAKKVGIISQTTQSKEKFLHIVQGILAANPGIAELHMFNTICLDTTHRQEEVKSLAASVGALLVIGSKTSANTKRLLTIGRRINKRTYLVESDQEVSGALLKGASSVGIISGASAPDWLVRSIVLKIKKPNK